VPACGAVAAVTYTSSALGAFRRMHVYNVTQSARPSGNAKVLKIDNADRSHVEKNWTPFVFNDNLFFIYCFIPLVLLLCDGETGKCSLAYKDSSPSPPLQKTFRGGSPAVLMGANTFVGWLHTTQPCTYFDPAALPTPARATKYVYRTCRFELEWSGSEKPKLTIGSEIVFHNNQIEQVYGSVENGLILNVDDCKTVVVEK